jgi:hypothetical protein
MNVGPISQSEWLWRYLPNASWQALVGMGADTVAAELAAGHLSAAGPAPQEQSRRRSTLAGACVKSL